jgi:hypothetical protein
VALRPALPCRRFATPAIPPGPAAQPFAVLAWAAASLAALAGSLAISGLALVGLTANELANTAVALSLEASDGRRESQLAAAA